ncbi:MAG TPA: shikimate dehydrogenase [Kofleriaceae bacterium]|jgi:shikimate dehydrogenase|nr:shikimate dehydrogenase [Kofleriaceae bacterium]
MIRGTTRVAAVIGWPVEHSRSPQMFEAAFAETGLDAVMIPIGVPPESFATIITAMRAMRALGACVTLPHKLAAAALCDELSPAARAIGAVNCLHISGDRLVGHNTDCHGFTDSLVVAGLPPAGLRCVLLGAGGAARAVAHGLEAAGAAAVDVLARSPEDVAWTAARPWTPDELRAAFPRADLLIDATPVGLAETAADLAAVDALPLDALRAGASVATLVYHRRTRLIDRAAERGHPTLDGRGMLVHQGARAFAIFTGAPPPVAAMQRALDGALAAH